MDDYLAAVTEGSRLVASLRNASEKDVIIKKGTLIGQAIPTTFNILPVLHGEKPETNYNSANNNKVNPELRLSNR